MSAITRALSLVGLGAKALPPTATPGIHTASTHEPAWAVIDDVTKGAVTTIPGVGQRFGLIRSDKLPRRGTQELLQAYQTNPYLRAVVHKIAMNAASVPFRLYARAASSSPDAKMVRDYATQRAGVAYKAAMLKSLEDRGELREILDHPLLKLLDTPNDLEDLDGRTLLQLTFSWLDVAGEAFWLFDTNAAGMPVRVWPIPPTWVTEIPSPERPFFRVIVGVGVFQVPITNVLWFKDPTLANPYQRGSGTGHALADELDIDENAAKHVGAYFHNRAMPDMIVAIKDADEPALKAAKAKFEQDHRGLYNAYRTAWTAGEVDVQRLDTSFKDMNLVELRKHSRDIVIQAFGISPEMIGILDSSNRATISEAKMMFAENVILPRLDVVGSKLQRFAQLYDERIVATFEDPRPDDKAFQLQAMMAHGTSVKENEWRRLQGLQDDPSGDVFLVPLTLQAVARLDEVEAPEPPAPFGGGAPPGGDGKKPPADAPEDKPAEGEGDNAEADDEGKGKAYRGRRKGLEEDEIDNVLEELRPERLTSETYPLMEDTISEIGTDVASSIGAPDSFSMLNPQITNYLDNFSSNRIVGLVNNTTREAIRSQLTDGVRNGEDIRALANRVRAVFSDADKRRAVVIARTEVIGASNFATYASHKMSGIVHRRQWVGTPDDRSRETHGPGSSLYGQVVAIDEEFESQDGGTAMYPGGFGIPEEDIQCRCATRAIFAGDDTESSAGLETIWRDIDARLKPHEDKFKKAIRRGFSAQREDILDALYAMVNR